MEKQKLHMVIPKLNLLSSVTTMSKAAEKTMDFSSVKNDEVLKKINKQILKEELVQ